MNYLKQLFLIFAIFCFSLNISAQDEKDDKYKEMPIHTFKLGLVAGLNAAQVDGDDLAGYDKLAFVVGGQVSYRIDKYLMPSVSILYSQKGSLSNFRATGSKTNYKLNENNKLYIEAFEKNVVLVSTSTLLATLSTVSSIWKQEDQKKNVMEIARQAGA